MGVYTIPACARVNYPVPASMLIDCWPIQGICALPRIDGAVIWGGIVDHSWLL